MAKEIAEKDVSVRKIMENRRAESTRKEIAFIEKTKNLTVDMYAGKAVKALGLDKEFLTSDNKFLLMQDAVLSGNHDKPAGNCYVAKAAVLSDKSSMKLREGEELKAVMQAYWDKPIKGAKDKSRYVEVVNAAKLEKFVPHNKEVSLETQEAVINALKDKMLTGFDNKGTKAGLASYEALLGDRDVAHVPVTEDKTQYLKDMVYVIASREAVRETVRHENVAFKREESKGERMLLKHFIAAELRQKLGLGADERNGLNRESAAAREEVVNLLKRDEKMLSNVARRSVGIVSAMERAYFNGMLKDTTKAKNVTKEQDKGKGLGD